MVYCPKCGQRLSAGPRVTDDTKVGWQGLGEDDQKTVILPDFGEGVPVKDDAAYKTGPYTEMKTDPQMDFTPEDFKVYSHFDTYGEELFGDSVEEVTDATVLLQDGIPEDTVQMPGYGGDRIGYGGNSSGHVPDAASYEGSGASGGPGPDFMRSSGQKEGAMKRNTYDNRRPGGPRQDQPPRQAPREKYFPNGFLQEVPDIEPVRRGQKFGPADFFATLFGLVTLALCGYIFYTTHGLSLIKQFFGGDMGLIMENMDDLRYFAQHQDVTWRIFYEIAALTMVITAVTVIFIILHCYVKHQAVGILKGVLLIIDSFFMAGLCGGYFLYYVITINGGVFVEENLTGLVGIAGVAMAAAAVLWFIYMFIWGITSFFKGFHPAVMALLALGFVFSIGLVAFNVLVGYKSCHNIMPEDAVMELLSTPVMAGAFMLLSVVACIEDFMAKKIVDMGE